MRTEDSAAKVLSLAIRGKRFKELLNILCPTLAGTPHDRITGSRSDQSRAQHPLGNGVVLAPRRIPSGVDNRSDVDDTRDIAGWNAAQRCKPTRKGIKGCMKNSSIAGQRCTKCQAGHEIHVRCIVLRSCWLDINVLVYYWFLIFTKDVLVYPFRCPRLAYIGYRATCSGCMPRCEVHVTASNTAIYVGLPDDTRGSPL